MPVPYIKSGIPGDIIQGGGDENKYVEKWAKKQAANAALRLKTAVPGYQNPSLKRRKERHATFRSMWADGTSTKAIMHEMDISKSTLNSWRRELGLPTRWNKSSGTDERRKTQVHVWLSPSEHKKTTQRASMKMQALSMYIRNLIMRDIGNAS